SKQKRSENYGIRRAADPCVSTSNKRRRIPADRSGRPGLKSHHLAPRRGRPVRKPQHLPHRLRQGESRNVTWLGDDFPVFWESARGPRVTDVDGHHYLDLTGAFAVSSLGHNAPVLRRALLRQSKKMWHGMGDVHPNTVKVELLE